MRIGIDIMGGDYAPKATVIGAIQAHREISTEHKLVLIGNRTDIIAQLEKNNAEPGQFEIVHAAETIEMGDHPLKAFSNKQQSGIVIGFKMLRDGDIDGFASAGNTGAMLVGAMQVAKSIPGVIRPSITATIPNIDGNPTVLLDVGINPDCKPDVLYQYAILGSIYAQHVHGIRNPKVGLLNIGKEEEKGNLLTKATYLAMQETKDFNFVGNIEGNDIFNFDEVDVIVCDGFVGNVILKQTESFYMMIKKRNIKDSLLDLFNFEFYGGTPILGINKPVIIGHGISQEIAIKNMILHTKNVIKANLIDKFKEAFNNGED